MNIEKNILDLLDEKHSYLYSISTVEVKNDTSEDGHEIITEIVFTGKTTGEVLFRIETLSKAEIGDTDAIAAELFLAVLRGDISKDDFKPHDI